MLAETLLSDTLPGVRLTDPAASVLVWMREHQASDLPVVQDRELLGLVSATELERQPPAATLADADLLLAEGSYVFGTQHAYDALSIMAATGRSIVPVLDHERHYQGVIDRPQMLRFMGDMSAATEPGAVIVLEMARINYSLREIASIIESNNVRVLSLQLSPVPDSTNLYVTIKISASELSQIMLSFERYGYTVAYTFFDTKQMDDTADRYEGLMRYLNV